MVLFVVIAATSCLSFSTASFAASPEGQGDTEMEAGHFQSACRLYQLALASHRTDVNILLKAARAYEAAGDLDEAIRRAREATVVQPDNADARLILGHLLDSNREEKAAILQFEMLLDIKKAAPEVRKAAYGPLLRLLKHQNKLETLVKTARRGAHEFPRDSDCLYNLGWALTQVPETDEKEKLKLQRDAIGAYQKSIALGEKRVGVHLNLASILADAGDREGANKELKTFVELAPDQSNSSEVAALRKRLAL